MPPINFTPAQSRGAYEQRLLSADMKIEFFTREIERQLITGLDRRTKLATKLLADKAKVNISLPVSRSASGQVIQRSRPGEYPRLETSRLMKDLFITRQGPAWYRLGTSLDYGLILETMLNRSFLRRTLMELRNQIRRILVSRSNAGDPPVFNIGDYRG